MLSNSNNSHVYPTKGLSDYSIKSEEANQPIVITTALPYANGEIHLGHISLSLIHI